MLIFIWNVSIKLHWYDIGAASSKPIQERVKQMNEWLMHELKKITTEAQAYMDGDGRVRKDIYTLSEMTSQKFEVDCQLFLKEGKLITVRHHSRFIDFPCHKHNYIEMMYVCSGEITHYIEEKELVMKEGDFLLLNQHVKHGMKRAGMDDIGVNFIVLPEFFDIPFQMMCKQNVIADFLLGILRQNDSIPRYLNFQLRGQKAISNLMENMIASMVGEGMLPDGNPQADEGMLPDRKPQACEGMLPDGKLQASEGMLPDGKLQAGRIRHSNIDVINQYSMGLVFLYLIDHMDTLSEHSSQNYEDIVVQAATRYIDSHYRTAAFSKIADDFKLSLPVLSRMIKKHTGFTFQELLMRKRFQKAAMFLAETELPVEEIAVNIGYENHSYFYRQFKARYGMTPNQYRILHKAGRNV